MSNYKTTHPYRVSLNFTFMNNCLKESNLFNPWNYMESDEKSILFYLYYKNKHSIIINGKTLHIAIDKIKIIKNILIKEINIDIKKNDIIWDKNIKEYKKIKIISEWWKNIKIVIK